MVKYRTNRGRQSGSKNGQSNRTDYDKNKPGKAEQQSVSFTPADESLYQDFFEKEGLKRTEFVRAAIHSYKNRFEWEKARDEIQNLIENQFEDFVERFGTRAEQERDSLLANQSRAAALTQVLYNFHMVTLHCRGVCDQVGFHPRFIADDDTMKAGGQEFHGDWQHLFELVAEGLINGDEKLLIRCERVIATHFNQDPSIFEIFEDITPLYNNAVGCVVLTVMQIRQRAILSAQQNLDDPDAPKDTDA